MELKKPQMWPRCQARGATQWHRHFKRRAMPEMGRTCGFF